MLSVINESSKLHVRIMTKARPRPCFSTSSVPHITAHWELLGLIFQLHIAVRASTLTNLVSRRALSGFHPFSPGEQGRRDGAAEPRLPQPKRPMNIVRLIE